MNNWANIRASSTIFEDEAILALNKPAGISVMGERHEFDIVELAQNAGEQLYPAHRIDKAASGIILFAKELAHHGDLTRQFNKRTVDKSYLAIARSTSLPGKGVIDLPLSVGRKNRVRIAAPRESIFFDTRASRWSVAPSQVLKTTETYPSVTTFAKIWDGNGRTLVLTQPVTGRRHQIRVHLAWTGHPIEGDPLFDKSSSIRGQRTCLHSWQLAFDARWLGNRRIEIEAPPGQDFWAVVRDDLPDQSIPGLLQHARRAAVSLKQDTFSRVSGAWP
jgi:tRNA pseudouridine32 synthase / 23S rRNA pseudouridine746 synthase